MKKGVLVILACALLFGCGKDPSTVRFKCTSDNPYYLTVDNVKSTIQPGEVIEYELTVGEHEYSYKQISGYLFYPTEGTHKFFLAEEQNLEFSFPD